MPTQPFITREASLAGIRSTCGLCGETSVAHRGPDSLLDEADEWETCHREECTPDTVRSRAAGFRDAAEAILHIARDGDPALWDDGDGHRALVTVLDGLRARATALDKRVEAALKDRSDEAV